MENGRVRSSISLMRTLPTGTYQPCKREDIGMHSLATVVGQTWGKLQEKYRECESILTILRGVYVTASSPKVF